MLIVKKRTILKNIAIFLCCGAAGWYLKGRLTPQAGGMFGMMGGGTPYVLTDKAIEKNVAPRKNYIGHTESIKSVDLRPQTTGYVEKVMFKEGSFVHEGDILFVIEQQRYMANLELAEATLAKAKANLVKVEKDFKRQNSLHQQKITSDASLDNSRNELAAAKAAVQQAQATMDLAKIDVDYTTVKAPINGYIGKALVTEGNYINSTMPVLARIVQTDPIRIVYSVNDKDIAGIRENISSGNAADIEIELPNGNTVNMKPKYRFTDNEVNTDTATIAVYDEFDNVQQVLFPGSFVQLRISTTAPQNAILIPQAAIVQDAEGSYVMVVNKDEIAEQRRVALGDVINEKQIVTAGLKAGENVIVQGVMKVSNGQKVKASSILPEKE